ncbi:MAG: hypothetical protein WCN88_04690 [Candidatus Falkowbacteria bacterium]
MTKFQRTMCWLMLVATIYFTLLVLWQNNTQCNYKGINYQLQEEKLTTSQLDALELIIVDTPTKITCYNDDTFNMANGKKVADGYVAVSDRSIPLNSKIYVSGYGEMIVGDRTNLRIWKQKGMVIDIWSKDCDLSFGVKKGFYTIIK